MPKQVRLRRLRPRSHVSKGNLRAEGFLDFLQAAVFDIVKPPKPELPAGRERLIASADSLVTPSTNATLPTGIDQRRVGRLSARFFSLLRP